MTSSTRRHPRIPFRARVWCSGRGVFFSDIARDLSEGGVGLETISSLSEGEEFELEFMLPGTADGGVRVRTRVVWVQPMTPEGRKFGAGLEFDTLTEEERKAIRRYVESGLRTEEGQRP